ncbi:MAG TPA: putative glycolipid-binding domain-containing protein, partial [Polyangia bacterium]
MATTRDDAGPSDVVATLIWRRLDVPGRDECSWRRLSGDRGWRLEGEAAFVEDGADARLRYRVDCDGGWRT